MRTWVQASLAILVLGLIGLILGPWWTLAVVAFLVGVSVRFAVPGRSFWIGMVTGFVLWGGAAAWFDLTGGSLPTMIAELFGLGTGLVLGVVIALFGGLTAGIFALLGSYLRATIQPLGTY